MIKVEFENEEHLKEWIKKMYIELGLDKEEEED